MNIIRNVGIVFIVLVFFLVILVFVRKKTRVKHFNPHSQFINTKITQVNDNEALVSCRDELVTITIYLGANAPSSVLFPQAIPEACRPKSDITNGFMTVRKSGDIVTHIKFTGTTLTYHI